MPPSTIIDASLSPLSTVYWVAERESIWKTPNLGGGLATWTESYTAAQFESDNLCTECQFLRVLAVAEGLVDALAYAKNSEGVGSAWHIRSNNGGATWNAHQIEDNIGTKDYTIVTKDYTYDRASGWVVNTELEIARISDDNTYSPWAMAYTYENITVPGGGDCLVNVDSLGGGATRYNVDLRGSNPSISPTGFANNLLGPNYAPAEAFLTDHFGTWYRAINGSTNMPKEEARNTVEVVWGGTGWDYPAKPSKTHVTVYLFYNMPSPEMPSAMDVAKGNASWIYVGLEDKIMASEDGGVTWFEFYGSHGAYDICVDPLLPGAVYYWSSTGSLNLIVKQTLGAAGTITTAGLMTESALDLFGRIARDPSSGRLFAIPNGTILKMRNLGATTELQTGLSRGRGLHVYPGQKLICCDGADIYISDNIQSTPPTVSLKKGGWTGYSSGVNSHRIVTS